MIPTVEVLATPGKMRIFIDGVESDYLVGYTPEDLTWSGIVTTVDGLMSVGRDPGESDRYFDGMMDDIGWFDDVLTKTELGQIRDTGGTGVAELAGDGRLVAHWKPRQSGRYDGSRW